MTDESSRAQLARLQAELADAQEDRDDTIREHAYDSQMNAYDKMTENIDESLDNNLRAMEANSEIQDRVVNEMLQKVLYNYNTAYNNINDTIFSSGTVMASTANSQVATTNDMLSTIQTSYQDIYNNINGLIGDTGTRVSSQTQTTLGDMKATIQHAMEDSQKAIDDWKKKNSELGTDVKTTFIASGNERTSENLAKTAADEAAAKATAKVTYDKNMAATAKKLVDELPSNIKLANKDQVNEAYKYYQELTADQKKYVDWDKLKAALDKITKLEDEKKKADEKAAAEAQDKADAEAKAKAASDKRVADAIKAIKTLKSGNASKMLVDLEDDLSNLRSKRDRAYDDMYVAAQKYGKKSKQYITAQDNYTRADDAYNQALSKYQRAISQQETIDTLLNKMSEAKAKADAAKQKYGKNSSQYSKALNNVNVAETKYDAALFDQQQLVDEYYGASKAKKAIKNIVSQGTKRSSKKLTDAEKKSNGDLSEYIASKYGYNINNGVISELAQVFGVKLANASKPTTAEMNKILKLMKEAGYARGTLSTRKDELNWTHEGEIIRRSDGAILRQLPQGTQVVPKLASENLMRWAQINPTQWMGEMQKVIDAKKSNQQQIINPILNYSPTINGSGLNQDQLAMILKKERDDAFRDFQNRLRKDLRMSGR